jgi:hypothetical protein
MRNMRLVLTALSAVPASTATHAILPGSCTSILYAVTVLNGTPGQAEREFTHLEWPAPAPATVPR